MSAAEALTPEQQADREKKRVALSSVLAAVLLTGMKLVIGFSTGSLGILSEAAHSGLDLVAAAVTYWAVRVSGKPADAGHTYGHGKYENLSALLETLLLLATCVWIVYEAGHRLIFGGEHVDASLWGFGVMVVSIVIDVSRSRALARVAKKYDSQALEADALHFSTDIWSSAVVIGGLFFVFLAGKLGIPWLAKADSVAALGVAGIVVFVSLKLGKRTVDALLDAVPDDLQERVRAAALRVPGVLDARRVRIRKSGPEVFADVILAVPAGLSLEPAHELADHAERAIREELPGADVVVHVEPVSAEDQGLIVIVRRLAAKVGLGAHAIRSVQAGGGRLVEVHLEVDDKLKVREAHDKATEFERLLREAVPAIDRVVSHLEPVGEGSAERDADLGDELPVAQALSAMSAEPGANWSAHDLRVHRVDGELSVSFHCSVDGEISIGEAHKLTERVEKELRSRVADLGRVVIHVEPPEDGAEDGQGQATAS